MSSRRNTSISEPSARVQAPMVPSRFEDPIALVAWLGITIAWADSLSDAALWFPDERLMVLDAGRGRDVVRRAVQSLLRDVADQ